MNINNFSVDFDTEGYVRTFDIVYNDLEGSSRMKVTDTSIEVLVSIKKVGYLKRSYPTSNQSFEDLTLLQVKCITEMMKATHQKLNKSFSVVSFQHQLTNMVKVESVFY